MLCSGVTVTFVRNLVLRWVTSQESRVPLFTTSPSLSRFFSLFDGPVFYLSQTHGPDIRFPWLHLQKGAVL